MRPARRHSLALRLRQRCPDGGDATLYRHVFDGGRLFLFRRSLGTTAGESSAAGTRSATGGNSAELAAPHRLPPVLTALQPP